MMLLNIKLVLETFESIYFMPVQEVYVWIKEVTSFNSCASDASCRRGFEKVNVVFLESFQISHAHVRRILWFEDLQPSIYMCP